VGRVGALDVTRRVRLRIPAGLCLREHVRVPARIAGHGGQDVVGGAVDDAPDRGDAVRGEVRDERPQHRHPTGHGGLEAHPGATGTGRGLDVRAVRREQRLVGRHERPSRVHDGHGRLEGEPDAADELDHDVDVRVVREGDQVVRPAHGVRQGHATGALGVTDRDRDQLRGRDAALDEAGAPRRVHEMSRDRAGDGAQPQQRDAQRGGGWGARGRGSRGCEGLDHPAIIRER